MNKDKSREDLIKENKDLKHKLTIVTRIVMIMSLVFACILLLDLYFTNEIIDDGRKISLGINDRAVAVVQLCNQYYIEHNDTEGYIACINQNIPLPFDVEIMLME